MRSYELKVLLRNNEEATKQSLIIPMLSILGYNVQDPREVSCEFDAFTVRRGNKVDYAVHIKGKPKIFIECKAANLSLNKYWEQLEKYFVTDSSVRFAILTNGIQYRFYTDSIEGLCLDSKPFFVFNIKDFNFYDLKILSMFKKNKLKEKRILKLVKKNSGDLSNYIKRGNITSKNDVKINKPRINNSNIKTNNLGFTIFDEDLDMRIFVPNKEEYSKYIKQSEDKLLTGNPDSSFFIAAFLEGKRNNEGTSAKNIKGYVVGEFVGCNEVTTSIVLCDEIDKYISRNYEIREQGFINAKMVERNHDGRKVKYFRSSIQTSVHNIEGLVQKFPY